MGREERSSRKSFFTLEQIKHRIYVLELKKRHEELEQQALLKQAEINLEENINPQARKADKQLEQIRLAKEEKRKNLIEESNQLRLWDHDYLGEMHKMMDSRVDFKRSRLYRSQYNHTHRRRTTGWGKYGNSTKAKESQAMRNYIRHTGGVTLDKMLDWLWKQLLNDQEFNEGVERDS